MLARLYILSMYSSPSPFKQNYSISTPKSTTQMGCGGQISALVEDAVNRLQGNSLHALICIQSKWVMSGRKKNKKIQTLFMSPPSSHQIMINSLTQDVYKQQKPHILTQCCLELSRPHRATADVAATCHIRQLFTSK